MDFNDKIIDKKLRIAVRNIVKAGMIPFNPKSKKIKEILKFYIESEEELDFIKNFRRRTLNIDQLTRKTKKSKEEVNRIANKLAKKGIIFNQPNSKGQMVFRLLPLVVVGTFEYTYMQNLPEKEEEQERLKKLANLYDKVMEELAENIQEGYENVLPIFKKQPPVDRTVPIYSNTKGETIEINQEVETEERIIPSQTVEEIINKFDDIAVGNCFCRQYRKMLDEPCKYDAPMETCFTFGKSARHVVEQGFARKIEKNEAINLLKEAEEAGLVHKAFHNGSDITREENSICNCCKDCCDTFNLWRMGATPIVTSTNHLSWIEQEGCIGCGICVEKCPMDAITLNGDNKAEVNEEYCIGCGVCAHFCPENTILLKEGMRKVFIPPPQIKN